MEALSANEFSGFAVDCPCNSSNPRLLCGAKMAESDFSAISAPHKKRNCLLLEMHKEYSLEKPTFE